MILIFSSTEDYSTNEVLRWLKYYNQSYLRLNDIDIYKLNQKIHINTSKIKFTINKKKYDIADFYSLWARRGGFYYSLPNKLNRNIKDSITIKKHIAVENESLIEYINKQFDNKIKLGSLNKFSVNKLISLKIAKSIGLKIPETIVTTQKKTLLKFIKKYKQVVTKNIQDILIIEDKNKLSFSYTELITCDFVKCVPETFPPSLFQEKIDKQFEIRSFFIDNEFYSMAIFSQSDSKTEVDFRKYNYKTPNRVCPFILPNYIQNQLKRFMEQVGLNTGSFDLIYNKNKEYIFLELNPIGQYEMVSRSCNYNLNQKISQYLICSNNNE